MTGRNANACDGDLSPMERLTGMTPTGSFVRRPRESATAEPFVEVEPTDTGTPRARCP